MRVGATASVGGAAIVGKMAGVGGICADEEVGGGGACHKPHDSSPSANGKDRTRKRVIGMSNPQSAAA